ncbi:MAG: NfeD family protein [Eubacteriales bacterium]|nr:NfeD family protein [Eubacteriales bacterium]MDD4582653.1 NfeD family protein [Eubacteriales bacterium]
MDILGYSVSMTLIWIGIAVIFAIIEAITLGLTTIWFTVGGLAACLVALLGGPLLLQVIVFLVVSALLLYFTKPLAEKKLKIGGEKTNVNALVGKTAVVTKDIIPHNTGQVKVNGLIWTALSEQKGMNLLVGTEVEIVRVEGVKLIVRLLKKD